MSWFKKFNKSTVVVEIPQPVKEVSVTPKPSTQVYPVKEYSAYVESIPHFDGTFTVRFYHATEPRILEEHSVVGEANVAKLIAEYMPKYKV